MRKSASLLAVVTLVTSAHAADIKVYPYANTGHYCPAGLQPVSIYGEISCGVPTETITYQQVTAHPVPRKAHRTYSRPQCPAYAKGCTGN